MVYLPTALAKAKGYFAEEGLDVEILDIKGGGSQAASALIGGSVDFSANAIDHAIKARTRGKDLIAVHSHVRLPVMGLVGANKLIVGSSGEELAKALPRELSGDPKLYAESFEHAREAFPADSLVSREGVARVIETMRVFDVVPAGTKIDPESLFDNRYVLKAL